MFAVAENPTVPGPEPLAPLVIVSQVGALLVAAQAQPAGAVTLTVPFEAVAATAGFNGDAANVHGAENENVSTDMGLDERPPEPTAATAAL